jgi:hypothetical protein
MSNKLTKAQLALVEREVNKWFKKQGDLLAEFGEGDWLKRDSYHPDGVPNFKLDWDWSGKPTPTFLWEGCPIEEWVHEVSGDLNDKLNEKGIMLEPYSSYALSAYRW